MAPSPEWFAGVDDDTILQLLDPLDPGTPDTATPVAWREHSHLRSHAQRRLGRQS